MNAKTILIADDETHILNVLSLKLQNAGYTVITAQDGAEAFELACTHHPDLVITDYQMPMLSGLELCTRLRCEPGTRDVPTILLTARGFSMSQREVLKDNIKEVITKPFSPREILARVQQIIGPVVLEPSIG
ncbi:MAG TPA: response regulator [Phycisphaerae bacterium]|nr:response regulator [Phycisphaerae bacterium]HRY69879.1 response regulator [Phycisphaerae bacterium]HSA25394.1 response regulator [Phycisphaerae bacterium]